MNILYDNKKYRSDLFHAITINGYNQEKRTLYYINTLSGKEETIKINKLLNRNGYLKYPIRIIYSEYY